MNKQIPNQLILNLLYDINGNIYIFKNNEYYFININKEDNIEFDKVININNITNNNIDNNIDNNIKLKKINKQNDLHIKTIENAIEELDEYDDDDEKDKFNDIYDKYNSYIYNPEQRFYHDENNYDEIDDDYDNTNFTLKERGMQLYTNEYFQNVINQTKFSFDIPIYEGLIIHGDIGTNNIIFRTEIQNDQALYRLTIYTSGIILLNIIGTKIIKFCINKDTLEIKKETYQNIKL